MAANCGCGHPLQVADEYGSEAYRGSIDVTVHDPNGKEIHQANAIQDDEIQIEAHGVKVRERILPTPRPHTTEPTECGE